MDFEKVRGLLHDTYSKIENLDSHSECFGLMLRLLVSTKAVRMAMIEGKDINGVLSDLETDIDNLLNEKLRHSKKQGE